MECSDENKRQSQTKKVRSALVSFTRPGILRRKTISCCRSAAVAASSLIVDLNYAATIAMASRISAIIRTDANQIRL